MTAIEVDELLEHVFDDEPPHTDSVPEVYRRAESLRRRRARAVVAASAATVVLVALAGYGFASAMLPRLGPSLAEGSVRDDPQPAEPAPTAPVVTPDGVERVQAIVTAALRQRKLDLADETPERGNGWRRFRIVGPPPATGEDDEDREGSGTGGADPRRDPEVVAGGPGGLVEADDGNRSGDADGGTDDETAEGGDAVAPAAVETRGTVHVAVYTTPGGLCFPVTSASKPVCARPNKLAGGVEFARYTDDDDVDTQVNEVIVRRRSDGRTVVVMVSGVPDTGDATQGRPPLTALEAAGLALDRRLLDAFAVDEWCDRPDPDCPPLAVPLPDEA